MMNDLFDALDYELYRYVEPGENLTYVYLRYGSFWIYKIDFINTLSWANHVHPWDTYERKKLS